MSEKVCPRCGEGLVFPRELPAYCEEEHHQITEAEMRRIHEGGGGLHHQSCFPTPCPVCQAKDLLITELAAALEETFGPEGFPVDRYTWNLMQRAREATR